SREAEISYLHRGGSARQNAGPAVFRVAHQVHDNVDFELVDQASDLLVRVVSDVDKSVERADEPVTPMAAVIRPERYPKSLEAPSIVALKHAGNHGCDHVTAEIGGEIGEPDAIARLRAPHGEPLKRFRKQSPQVCLRAGEMVRRGMWEIQQGQRV